MGPQAILGMLNSGGNVVVDTAMKVVNFIGFKNIASAAITTAGALGENEAVMFAGIGSFLGGKSFIGSLALAGAGFAAGSMLQAEEVADEIADEIAETAESAEFNRYAPSSIDDVSSVDTSAETPNIDDGGVSYA